MAVKVHSRRSSVIIVVIISITITVKTFNIADARLSNVCCAEESRRLARNDTAQPSLSTKDAPPVCAATPPRPRSNRHAVRPPPSARCRSPAAGQTSRGKMHTVLRCSTVLDSSALHTRSDAAHQIQMSFSSMLFLYCTRSSTLQRCRSLLVSLLVRCGSACEGLPQHVDLPLQHSGNGCSHMLLRLWRCTPCS